MIDGCDSRSIRSAQELAEFVRAGRSHTPDLKFAIEVPPLLRRPSVGALDGHRYL
ncbi:hypothetical protein RKD31_000880 [Streptomyces sp. SAI-163]